MQAAFHLEQESCSNSDLDQPYFTVKQVLKIITGGQFNADRIRLFELEKLGKIPEAKRVTRGKVDVRYWGLNDLPLIAPFLSKLSDKLYYVTVSMGLYPARFNRT